MPITEKQRQRRLKYIGSSDIAAVMGIDPWRTAGDVWLEKRGYKEPTNESPAMRLGNALERALLALFMADHPNLTMRANDFRVSEDGICSAHLDGLGSDCAVEVKTVGLEHYSPEALAGWGEAGTADVPRHVYAQCQHQLRVLGSDYELVWVPALIAGRGLVTYHIPPDNAACDYIGEWAARFWHSVQHDSTPPTMPTIADDVLRIPRVPGKRVTIPEEIAQVYALLKGDEKQLEIDLRIWRNRLIEVLGDAQYGDYSEGHVTATMQTRTNIDRDKLRAEYPDVADACVTVTRFPTLRLHASKAKDAESSKETQ